MFFLLLACAPRLTSPERPECENEGNVWSHADPAPTGLEAQGFEEGERPPDFCQLDQNGDKVSLYQFYGSPVIVDVSTGWCAPCQQLAHGIGQTQREYEDFGLVYMSVFPQDFVSAPPTPEFADVWEKEFMVRQDLDELPLDDIAPVIADVDLWSFGITETQFPRLLLLDEELRVVSVLPTNDDAIQDELDLYFGLDSD